MTKWQMIEQEKHSNHYESRSLYWTVKPSALIQMAAYFILHKILKSMNRC